MSFLLNGGEIVKMAESNKNESFLFICFIYLFIYFFQTFLFFIFFKFKNVFSSSRYWNDLAHFPNLNLKQQNYSLKNIFLRKKLHQKSFLYFGTELHLIYYLNL